jgi:DNA-directed RNA polymerase subunit RPC12/RpoP
MSSPEKGSLEQTEQDDKQIQPSLIEKVRRYRCPGCGADLLFEPKDGALTCQYCQHKEQIAESKEAIVECDYERYLKLLPEQLIELAPDTLEVDCKSCGAKVTFTPPVTASQCSFCGAALVAQAKSPDPILAPAAVLPFRIEKSAATEAIKDWIATRWFAPDALKRFAVPGGISGVYIPFWTYDSHTTSHYTGQRGNYYYETEYYTETDSNGNQVQATREVRRTAWYPVAGTVTRWFDDVLISGTKSLPPKALAELEPWDLPELKPYDPAFLAGYKAERYQVTLPEGFEKAQSVMARVIENDICYQIGGDEQRILSVQTHHSAITFKHILLPVYVGAYRLQQKLYQVVVNARTGEVQGERPYSWIKITLFTIFVLSLLYSLWWAVQKP